MKAIREAVGYDVKLRIDANQGWKAKEAVKALNKMEDEGLDIEFVEQPVPAHDIDELKYVTDNVSIPVLADESVFSPEDALTILQRRAADFVNIKLMKTGGMYNALKICSAAEVYGVECMIGCMLEAKVSVNAAVHLAAAKAIITKIDLDGPVLCSVDPIEGGAVFDEERITLNDEPGFGIKKVNGIRYLD
jgi:L-alanine-DL-glutamate epimerase-like enolase superfamily enzyme